MNSLIRAACFAAVWACLWLQPSPVFPAGGSPDAVVAIALRNWPPHYLIDSKTGEPAGFAIEVMNRVAKMCGLEVRYVVYDNWPAAFAALKTNQATVAPNLGITEERLGTYDFTVPYETFRIGIFVRSTTGDIHDAGELAGRKVGVVKDNQGLVLMRERGGSDLMIYNSVEEAFMALLSGSVDALVGPGNPILGVAMKAGLEGKIKIVGKPLQEIKRAIAVRKGEPQLFQKLDNAIRQFIQTPDFQVMYQKWHGKPQPFWTATRVGVGMGIVLGLTVFVLMAWRYVSIHKLNRSLAETEARFRGIVENTDAGYFFIDRAGKFQNVNAAWLKLHGYDSREEVIGQPFSLTQVPADLEASQRNVGTLLAGDPIPTGESTRRCRDGSVGYHTFSAHPVVQGGKVVGLEGFIIDSTDSFREAEEKRKIEERYWLVDKAESLGRMAGAIAHHFNNQLAVVQGNLELALDDLAGHEKIGELLGEAVRASRRASEISLLLLTYLGQSQSRAEPLNLSAVCRRQVALIRDGLPEGITLETDWMDPGPLIRISENQLEQVLKHLITNAAEAMGDRGGKMKLAIHTFVASDVTKICIAPADWKPGVEVYACLAVSDSGCGMSQEDMDRLFDPFFTTKFIGRGLGLPVVLGIVKTCNGAIGVESRKDQGSTFRVCLPVAADTVARQPGAAVEAHPMATGVTVLLVEDQPAVRQMAEKMLVRLGYAVLGAADGAEALELFGRHREAIGCVITDLTMPGMDGWQVLDALRKLQPNLPVILASGYDEAMAMGRDDAEKPDAFLHKPYSKEQLKNVLKNVCPSPCHSLEPRP